MRNLEAGEQEESGLRNYTLSNTNFKGRIKRGARSAERGYWNQITDSEIPTIQNSKQIERLVVGNVEKGGNLKFNALNLEFESSEKVNQVVKCWRVDRWLVPVLCYGLQFFQQSRFISLNMNSKAFLIVHKGGV